MAMWLEAFCLLDILFPVFNLKTKEFEKYDSLYYVSGFKVVPSKKFKDEFKKIITQESGSLSYPVFHSFIDIIKKRKFVSHHKISRVKFSSINNLLSDLQYQVKHNLSNNFKGYFHDKRNKRSLPCIYTFEVGNLNQFHKDKLLSGFFDSWKFKSENDGEIYFSNHGTINQVTLVQEKPTQENAEDFSFKSEYLASSLIFPCVYTAILREQLSRINNLKIKVYDFAKYSNNGNRIIKLFLKPELKRWTKELRWDK